MGNERLCDLFLIQEAELAIKPLHGTVHCVQCLDKSKLVAIYLLLEISRGVPWVPWPWRFAMRPWTFASADVRWRCAAEVCGGERPLPRRTLLQGRMGRLSEFCSRIFQSLLARRVHEWDKRGLICGNLFRSCTNVNNVGRKWCSS